MYAVIKTGGKQYRVAADDVLTIEKVPGDAGAKVEFGFNSIAGYTTGLVFTILFHTRSTVARGGTVVADGEGILATDEPMEFARHVIDLLRDANRRWEMARRARSAAEANYRWAVQLARLDQVVAAAVSRSLRRTASAPAN